MEYNISNLRLEKTGSSNVGTCLPTTWNHISEDTHLKNCVLTLPVQLQKSAVSVLHYTVQCEQKCHDNDT